MREDLAGTIAAAVVNTSMARPKEPVKRADFFAPLYPVKRKRVNHAKAQDNMTAMLELAAMRHGMIVQDQQGNILSDSSVKNG